MPSTVHTTINSTPIGKDMQNAKAIEFPASLYYSKEFTNDMNNQEVEEEPF